MDNPLYVLDFCKYVHIVLSNDGFRGVIQRLFHRSVQILPRSKKAKIELANQVLTFRAWHFEVRISDSAFELYFVLFSVFQFN